MHNGKKRKPLEEEGGEEEEPLEYSEPEELGSMNNIDHGSVRGGPHEKLEVVIDSGASACALPQGWRDHVPTLPLRAGERATYRTANGGIANAIGRKSIYGEATTGATVGLSSVEMEVHRPLASVSQMVRNGNIVVFGDPKAGS